MFFDVILFASHSNNWLIKLLIAYYSFLLALIFLENFHQKKSFILLEQSDTLKIQFWLLMLCTIKKNLTETSVFFSPKEYHDISIEILQSRFASAKTMPGTQKYHSIISSSRLTLILKIFILTHVTFFQRN